MTRTWFFGDNTLTDTRQLQLQSTLRALEEVASLKYETPFSEKLLRSSLPTRAKLSRLCEVGLLRHELIDTVLQRKRALADERLARLGPDSSKIALLARLRFFGHKVAVVTNSNRASAELLLDRLQLAPLVDLLVTGDDTGKLPDPYLKAIEALGPGLAIEDSDEGVQAAEAAGCPYVRVTGPEQVSLARLAPQLQEPTILMPLGGDALTEVSGKTLLEIAIDSLDIEGPLILVAPRAHAAEVRCAAARTKRSIIVVAVPEERGALEACLAAAYLLPPDRPLIITSYDLHLHWTGRRFLQQVQDHDAGLVLFRSSQDCHSFAQLEDGLVRYVVEKQPVSDMALVGVHYWRRPASFLDCARHVCRQSEGREVKISKVFNLMIAAGSRVLGVELGAGEKVLPLRTPEQLIAYKSSLEAECAEASRS